MANDDAAVSVITRRDVVVVGVRPMVGAAIAARAVVVAVTAHEGCEWRQRTVGMPRTELE